MTKKKSMVVCAFVFLLLVSVIGIGLANYPLSCDLKNGVWDIAKVISNNEDTIEITVVAEGKVIDSVSNPPGSPVVTIKLKDGP